MAKNLFFFKNKVIKNNGIKNIIVEHYSVNPEYDIFIDSINIKTGLISQNRITDFSIHRNIEMYMIKSLDNSFDTFWASEDHSLIAYDSLLDEILVVTPIQLIGYKQTRLRDNIFLIKKNKNVSNFIGKTIKETLEASSQLISINNIEIKFDSTKTEAYDFTVENDYTFALHDGLLVQDTYSVFSVLTLEAQHDARQKMYKPLPAKRPYEMLWDLKQDIQLGIYMLSRKVKDNDFTFYGRKRKYHTNAFTQKELYEDYRIGSYDGYHIYDIIDYIRSDGKKIKSVTLGLAILNAIFEPDFLDTYFNGFIDFPITKKSVSKLKDAMSDYYDYQIGIAKKVDDIKHRAFFYSTIFPIGLLLSEFLNAKKFNHLKEKYKNAKTILEKQKVINEIESYLKKNIADDFPMIFIFIDSGARGNINQLRQMFVTKGLIQDAKKEIKNLDNNFLDGFDADNYFYAGFAARKGMMDRALNTATTGYLMRKLVYASGSVKLSDKVYDCGSKRTVTVHLTDKNASLLYGRFMLQEDGSLKLLKRSNYKDYIGKDVKFRTPIFCKSKEICHVCAGSFIKELDTNYIGVLAGETMGERGTQEIMKTFHTGGSVSITTPNVFKIIKNNNPFINMEILKDLFFQDSIFFRYRKSSKIKSFKLVIPLGLYSSVGLTKTDFSNIYDPSQSKLSVIRNDNENNKKRMFLNFPFLFFHLELSNSTIENIIIDTPLSLSVDTFDSVKLIEDYKPVGLKEEIHEEGSRFSFIIEYNFENKPLSNSNDVIFEVENQSSDLNNLMGLILGLIERRNKLIRYPEAMFNKLSEIYGNFGVAYIHMEIFISQLFRTDKDPYKLYRLVHDDPSYKPVLLGIKNIPVYDSWLMGLLFENAQKSFEYGVISDTSIESPFEKLITSYIV